MLVFVVVDADDGGAGRGGVVGVYFGDCKASVNRRDKVDRSVGCTGELTFSAANAAAVFTDVGREDAWALVGFVVAAEDGFCCWFGVCEDKRREEERDEEG